MLATTLASTTLLLAAALLTQDPLPATPAPELGAVAAADEAEAGRVLDMERLVRDLLDRRTLTRLPQPSYEARFASAGGPEDEPSVAPEGSREFVLFDLAGPGSLIRLASDGGQGRLRIYLDGSDTPLVDEPLDLLLAGGGAFPAALSSALPSGPAALLPVPFAGSCRITLERDTGSEDAEDSGASGPHVTLQWRRYPDQASVVTLSPESLERAAPALREAAATLENFQYAHGVESFRFGKIISYSGTGGTSRWNAMSITAGESGPRVVSELRIGPLTAETPELLDQLLRRTILSITFDGHETVHTPLGDFFGAGVGVAAVGGPMMGVTPEGLFICRWPMPYKESCFIRIEAQMDVPFAVPGVVTVEPRPWTDDTLYFHAAWRYEPYLESPPAHTWELLSVQGRGLLVGESLAVGSRDGTWRKGRARIIADGREYVSGGVLDGLGLPPLESPTGSATWFSPLGSVPRCSAADGDGWTTLQRQRTLDAVPFRNGLRYELGVEFPGTPLRSYAATTWFYANANARVDSGQVDELCGLGITQPE